MASADTPCVPSIEGQTQSKVLKFSSTLSTYVTLLGYSLGFTDIWRFPFLTYRNGGGAFLIPFIVMACACGVPIYFMEYSISKFSGKGPLKVWDICPLFRGVGISISIAYAMYMIGTSILRCWLFVFIFSTFQSPIPYTTCDNKWNSDTCRWYNLTKATSQNDWQNLDSSNHSSHSMNVTTSTEVAIAFTRMSSVEEFWQYEVLQLSSGISDTTNFMWKYVILMIALRVIVMAATIKSIKTMERVFIVTLTFPILFAIGLFIRSLLLPGAVDGIYYFFYPDYKALLTPRVWIEATLMVFYTLTFGWGGIMLLGSHSEFRQSSYKTSIICSLLDIVIAAFNGLVVFSVLGNMAHTYGLHVTEVINAGFSTGMVTYITALSALPFPQLWIFLFIVSGILASLDSQMVPVDMAVQMICDMFPNMTFKLRMIVLCTVSFLIFLFSLPTCTGAGAYIFLLVDWYAGSWTGPIMVLIELLAVSWIYGLDRLSADVELMTGTRLPAVYRWGLAFSSPAIVLVIFLMSCVKYVPPNYGSYHYPGYAQVLGWGMVVIIVAPILGFAVLNIYRANGTLTQRVKSQLRPTESWGPSSVGHANNYLEHKKQYANRTLRDLMCYNVLGRYPKNSDMMSHVPQELSLLSEENNML